jgi:hypothetical protein
MSRARFLADEDLKDAIIRGVRRRAPSIEFVRLRELGMEAAPDAAVLEFAAQNSWLVVSHDVNTMTAEAFARIAVGETMSGLLLVHQRDPIGAIIDSLLTIWQASEAEEWVGVVCYLPF